MADANETDTCCITLNVGGVVYKTTKATLTSNGERNYFTGLLSGNFKLKKKYFIDRDGDLFKYILAFLRTRTIHLSYEENNSALKNKLADEFSFFCLDATILNIIFRKKKISVSTINDVFAAQTKLQQLLNEGYQIEKYVEKSAVNGKQAILSALLIKYE
mmetsp:Transcript_4851/g.5254  ORF Transcript_4851/g.5254 Transcript_4851/m.5254 type:complete len:160 (-) Transcript_4851:13-492(-)